MAKRAKDPLTAATTSLLKPVLADLGFQRLTPRTFVRYHRPIVQYLTLTKSGWGGGSFNFTYWVLPTIPLKTVLGTNFAHRVGNQPGTDGWWPSKTHELADASMVDVIEQFQIQAVPVLEASMTAETYVDAMLEQHHYHWCPLAASDRGCVNLYLGRVDEGQRDLEAAVAKLQLHLKEAVAKLHPDDPPDSSDWLAERLRQHQEILDASKEGVHMELLDRWMNESEAHLGLTRMGPSS